MNRVACLLVVALAGCFSLTSRLQGSLPPRHPAASQLGSTEFVVVPALDARAKEERVGTGSEVGVMLVGAGAFFSKKSGAAVSSPRELVWGNNAFSREPPGVTFGVASDLGAALEAASGRAVHYETGDVDRIAASAVDGTVVVTVVVTSATRISPENSVASATSHDEVQGSSVYRVTESQSSFTGWGPFWAFAFQIELAEISGHHVARRLVRYAAASSNQREAYGEAIADAANTVVSTIAEQWGAGSSAAPERKTESAPNPAVKVVTAAKHESNAETANPTGELATAPKPSELATPNAPAPDPNRLDRDQIAVGVFEVRENIHRCGIGFPGVSISVSVVVAPNGEVTSVTVNDAADRWLSSCVRARMKAAHFAVTPNGGAFRQAFKF